MGEEAASMKGVAIVEMRIDMHATFATANPGRRTEVFGIFLPPIGCITATL